MPYPTTLTPEQRTLRAQIAANTRWANTSSGERVAVTAKARQAAYERFEKQVDPEGVMLPAERAKLAENARRAHFQRMALASSKARRRKLGT